VRAVEHRYVIAIVAGAIEDGLELDLPEGTLELRSL
jgi:hypothetical protein